MEFSIVHKLKMLCQQKNVSYYELAKKSNIANSTIYNIMNGKTNPRFDTLCDLCSALDTTLEEIFADESYFQETNNITEDDYELVQKILALSPEKKKMVEMYVNMIVQYQNME